MRALWHADLSVICIFFEWWLLGGSLVFVVCLGGGPVASVGGVAGRAGVAAGVRAFGRCGRACGLAVGRFWASGCGWRLDVRVYVCVCVVVCVCVCVRVGRLALRKFKFWFPHLFHDAQSDSSYFDDHKCSPSSMLEYTCRLMDVPRTCRMLDPLRCLAPALVILWDLL